MKLDDAFYTAFDELAIRHEDLGVRKELLEAAMLGYRMGLERAARKCEEFAGARTNGHQCAAAIREMAHD